jgi:hypothetical protein
MVEIILIDAQKNLVWPKHFAGCIDINPQMYQALWSILGRTQ